MIFSLRAKTTTHIFGPYEDFILFIVPLIIAFFTKDFFSKHTQSLIYIILFRLILQSGHLFITAFPFMEKRKTSYNYYIAAYVAIFVIINFISLDYFINVFSLVSLFHIVHQHIGWYAKSNPSNELLWKKSLFKYSFFFILTLWLLNLFPASPGYVYKFTLFDVIKNIYQFPLYIRVIFANFLYVLTAFMIFGKKNIIDRPFYFLGTFGWITLGIFFEKPYGNYFFTIYALLSHGPGYTVFILKKWPARLSLKTKMFYKRKTILFTALVSGYLYSIYYIFFIKFIPQLLVIPWIPTIVHYAADSVIWKSKKILNKEEPAQLSETLSEQAI